MRIEYPSGNNVGTAIADMFNAALQR
jgi:hypothetical protein